MKSLEKLILILFSIIILVISVFLILTSTEMIKTTEILGAVEAWLVNNKVAGIVIGSIFALFGLIGVFSCSSDSEDVKTGLAIKNEQGTVYITKDTFENIILSITKNYAELKNVKVELNVDDTGVTANIFAYILPDTILPDLTSKLQAHIKNGVKKQTTVEIKEANIKVKGVYFEQQKQTQSK